MRILFLSQRVPYPPNRGDKITTWQLIDRLRREHEVRVVAFTHDAADLEAAAQLRAMDIPVSAFPLDMQRAKLRSLPVLLTRKALTLSVFGSRAVQAEVDRLAVMSDLAYAYSSSMGAFLVPHPEIARVMHFAELDSDKWRQYAERGGFPSSWVYRREWRTLRRFEEGVAHSFDQNVFCTPLEEAIFQREIPGAPSIVLRNGVDLEFFTPRRAEAEPGRLVFTGVMDYLPNVDACVWFAREVFPEVRRRHPEARFVVVGSHPTRDIQRLAGEPGIEVTGFVDDVREELARAALSVAPLRIARGVQNKVLEAMAMGLPIVGTTSATQGIEARAEEHFLVEDGAGGQIEALCGLLGGPASAEALGERARRHVEEHYSWEVVLAPLEQILSQCTRRGHDPNTQP